MNTRPVWNVQRHPVGEQLVPAGDGAGHRPQGCSRAFWGCPSTLTALPGNEALSRNAEADQKNQKLHS